MLKKEIIILAAVAVLIMALSLAACAPAKPPQQFTLRIGIFPTQGSLPVFVMQELGIDKKNGLDLTERSYQSAEMIIQDIAAGSLDMSSTVSSQAVISAAEKGLIPGTIIPIATSSFVNPEHPATGILAAHSITSWQNLKGQQIAVNAIKSINGAAITGRLKQEAVTDYTLLEIPIPNMGLSVAGGNVAAATMSEPFMTQSLLRKDGKLLGWIIGGPPLEKVTFTMIISSTNLIKDNPQAVKAFLRAHLQAVNWIDKNDAEARKILVKRLDMSQEISQKIRLLYFPLNARIDLASLESIQPLLIDIGLLKAPIPASKLYDETLLNEVLKEKR